MVSGIKGKVERTKPSISWDQAKESSRQKSSEPSSPNPTAEPKRARKRVSSHLSGVSVFPPELSLHPDPAQLVARRRIASRGRPHHGLSHASK
jgi:hypothetical protein